MARREADRRERSEGHGADVAMGRESLPPCAEARADGLCIAIKLRPGARRAAFLGTEASVPVPGWPSARLALAVTEPAEAGRANEAAIAALAAALAVRPGDVTLRVGKTSRNKLFFVAGDPDALALRLSRLAQNPVQNPKA